MVLTLVAGLLAAIIVFSGVFLVSIQMGLARGSIASRLSKFSEARTVAVEERKARRRERSKAADMIVRTVDRALAGQSFAEKLRNALARADLRFTVAEYLILWVAAFVLGIFIGDVIFRSIVYTVILGLLGLIGPRWYIYYRAGQRLKQFSLQLADTIVMMANSLRSGYSMLQSMEMISREMPQPIAMEFSRVIKEVGIGLSPEEALTNLVRRMRSGDLEIMVMAINVQREIGGNLSIILDTIAHTIRERVRIKGEIKTLTAQATYSGYVISLLPLLLAFAIWNIDHKYIGFFWENHSCGLPLMGATLGLMVVGFFVMRRITKIEV